MSNSNMENHPNPHEIFPLWGLLGSPGKGAVANLLAALAGAAVAAAALFHLYIICTPISIEDVRAQIQAVVYNRESDQRILWYLIQGDDPDAVPVPSLEEMTPMKEDKELLYLENLQPGTEYTLVFMSYDETGNLTQIHTFTFWTLAPGNPTPDIPKKPDNQEGNQKPNPPPRYNPEWPDRTPSQTPEDPAGNEGETSWNPPVYIIPPSSSSSKQNPKAQPPRLSNPVPDDPEFEEAQGSYDVVFTFDLDGVDVESITVNGTLTRREYLLPEEMEPSETRTVSSTYSYPSSRIKINGNDQAVLTYTVPSAYYDSELSATLNYVNDAGKTGSVQTKSIFNGPGFLYFLETGSRNTLAMGDISSDGQVPCTLVIRDYHAGSESFGFKILDLFALSDRMITANNLRVEYGKDMITCRFDIPADALVTDEVEVFVSASCYPNNVEMLFTETYYMGPITTFALNIPGAGESESLDENAGQSSDGTGQMVYEPTDPNAAYSVGPISINETIHGLTCTQATFNTAALPSAAQLTSVLAGETVYLEILLQGIAENSFQLSAHFAPSEKITDLQVLNQDAVSILDSDAYLRISFTMPASSVTADDLGFQGFRAY